VGEAGEKEKESARGTMGRGKRYYLLLFGLLEHMWEFGEILAAREECRQNFPRTRASEPTYRLAL